MENIHKKSFLKVFKKLDNQGSLVSPRDQLCIEVENFSYTLPPYVRFPSFKCRNYKLNYLKKEMLWYLKGDKFDTSICAHAKMWRSLVNDDGSINSNYGQYIFGEQNQFDNVIKTLNSDPDSRRASIVILANDHLKMKTNDVPCTYSLNFRVRLNKLNMSVHMRSQDAVFGMGNDAPCFSIIHEMVYMTLKGTEDFCDLQLGEYRHTADSFHVYERHFGMMKEIIAGSEYVDIDCPRISSPEEVTFLRAYHNDTEQLVPDSFKFAKWLTNR